MRILALIVFMTSLSMYSFADESCRYANESDIDRISNINSWVELYALFQNEKSCLDGYILDSVSDEVVKLIIRDFDGLKKSPFKEDNEFTNFVANQINDSLEPEQYSEIKLILTQRCDNGEPVCVEFKSVVRSLDCYLKELNK